MMNRGKHLAAAVVIGGIVVLGRACPGQEASSAGQTAEAAPGAAALHTIGAAKLIIGDVKKNQQFFEKVFGMKEVGHYQSAGVYDEPIMGFDQGARLALFSPLAEAPLEKSQYPVVLIYTPDLEATVARLEAEQASMRRLPGGRMKIVIARDPSGNAVEILERPGSPYAVGGSKLIVADRQKAEDFFARVFGAKPGQRFVTATYDEVLMNFGEGPFLALFQPKNEDPLPKSQYPQVAIYTSEWDAVVERIEKEGLGYRRVATSSPSTRIIIAKDPGGNAIEIISRAPQPR